jgi:hypothetical protein
VLTALAASGHLAYDALCIISWNPPPSPRNLPSRTVWKDCIVIAVFFWAHQYKFRLRIFSRPYLVGGPKFFFRRGSNAPSAALLFSLFQRKTARTFMLRCQRNTSDVWQLSLTVRYEAHNKRTITLARQGVTQGQGKAGQLQFICQDYNHAVYSRPVSCYA